MKRFSSQILFIFILALSFTACKKDDPVHEHENEFINAVRIEFIGGEETKVFEWNEDAVDPIVLTAGTLYQTNITFLNIEHHEEDITHEIEEDGHNHQVFITTTPADLLQIKSTDKDKNGLPIGIESEITTTSVNAGSLRVLLKHYSGNKDGNPSNGSTDVDISFPLTIQ